MTSTDIWNKIKEYAIIVSTVVGAAAVALFFWEKNKAEVDQALLDEDKVNLDLKNDDVKIANNDQQLSQLELQRKAAENAPVPEANITDITKWFNRKQ